MNYSMSKVVLASLCFVVFGAGSTYIAVANMEANETAQLRPALDVPYVPTPDKVVEKMLELAEVKKGDTVYDLGSGDGRIVIAAAKKYGAKGVGIDLDPVRVDEAKKNVARNDVDKLVEIKQGNALETDVSSADVVTLYLLPSVNLELRPTLQALKPGTRIVSHDFDMGDWKPIKTVSVEVDGREHTVYLWEVGENNDVESQAESKNPTP